ncbi:hypothetical protein L1D29_13725 [Shewanella insulae]|uniref:hypothetical protein n=1 Tax=Shewanella insulae TaxID=2681496 RepID=UPI001EFDD45F|nr:hypothetical protein [Shewanella insulae]MCG9713877.1 hypothetical protein [Shewanella insulae]
MENFLAGAPKFPQSAALGILRSSSELNMTREPKYPITVHFLEDAEIETYDSELELVTSLEWFDSSDPEWKVKVQDVTGASINLKVDALQVTLLEYKYLTNR